VKVHLSSKETTELERRTLAPELWPNPVVAVDTKGRVTFANDAARRVLEPDGSARAFLPADLDSILDRLRHREQVTVRCEVTVGERVFEESIQLRPDHDAAIIHATDVTEIRRTEQELRRQEALLKALVESPTDIMILALDRNRCYTAFNRAHQLDVKKVYGADIRVGASVLEPIDSPEIRARMKQTIDRVLAGESFTNVELDQRRGSWYEINWSPIHAADGNVIGATAFVRDITRRKRVETALAESEHKYRSLFESSNDAMMLLTDNRFFDCNPAALRAFGYSTREEFVGKHPADVSPPRQPDGEDSREAADERIAVAFLTGRNSYEWYHQRADGTIFPADVLLTPMEFRGQKMLQATVRDISDRKQAVSALRSSEEQFRRAFEDSGAGKLLTGLDGRLLRVNRAFASMLGYSPGELESLRFAAITHPADVAPNMEVMNRLQEGAETSARFEKRYLHKDGSVVWADLSVVLLRDSEGRPHHFVADAHDVTAHKHAEALLRETTAYLENLIGYANAPIVVWDPEFRITRFNRAFERLTGRTEREVLGRDIGLLFPDEQRQESLALIRRTATGERWETVEIPIRDKDGSVRIVLWNSSTLLGPDGRTVVATIAQGQDITERRQYRMQVEAERDRLRHILDAIPDGVYLVGQDCRIQYINPALVERGGPVNGRKCYEYFHNLGEPCPDCPNPQVFAGTPTHRQHTTRGSNITYDIQDVLVTGDDGQPARLVFLRDITERRRAELRDRQHLEDTTLLRDTALGFISLDRDADIYGYVAQRLAQLAGEAYVVVNSYDPAADEFRVRAIEAAGASAQAALKLVGPPPSGMPFQLPPEERRRYLSTGLMKIDGGLEALAYDILPESVTEVLDSVFVLGDIYAMSLSWQGRILGTVYLLLHRDVPLRDPALIEAFVNQAAIAIQHRLDSDELVQHREHLQELVRERTSELEAANRELEAFSYSVSHDLRAPLRAIDGFTQALAEDAGELNEKARYDLDRVCSAARRMSQLIDDLLDLARIARLPLERKPVDLSELARSVAADLQQTAPDRRVRFVIADGMTAPADAVLAQTVLRNLLGNAWKFTATHPTARIEFGLVRGNREQVFFVRDDGVGFDMTYANKLFAPFQRLHTGRDFPGSGIGLAIVQRIVRRHGGRAWIQAEVDGGTTCWFTLEPAVKEMESGRETRESNPAG
jgi:PAS domain S-box-containing protein